MGSIGERTNDSSEEAVLRLVRDHAAELLRFAQRFSICADDAHDAYQRAIEILVRRMRSDPPAHPLPWLRTVIKHESLAVRAQREELLGRKEFSVDSHADRHVEDLAERAVGFERLWHTAEALQRLKPQEVAALVQRAQGLTYDEIAARNGWTYTKTNRCITEGRRALLKRLGAIESGAECARWLPLLSGLADGEATAVEVAQLRPHLRACPACRATLRAFHGAPSQVAAIVPVGLVGLAGGGGAARLGEHLDALAHALLGRLAGAALRVQGALDTVPGAKLAAVAASSAALAGGGVAIEHVAVDASRSQPVVHAQRAASSASSKPAGAALSLASRARSDAGAGAATVADPGAASGPEWRARTVAAAGPSEFGIETPHGARAAFGAGTASAHAPSPAPHAFTAARAHPERSPPAEFAGP